MNDLLKICEFINQNSQKIIDNLDEESLVVYQFIKNEYKKGDITKNHIFQFSFRSFYKLDSAGLTKEFKEKYFELFELNSSNSFCSIPEMQKTLIILSGINNFKKQNTVQFSFVTKMFHTIDNRLPIYDNEVITVFDFKQPYYISDIGKRISQYLIQYNEIGIAYKNIESDNLLKDTLKLFNNKFPCHKINNTMVLDFIFWSAGKLINKRNLLPIEQL